jgi:phosphatidylserine/phosphatidylglycerophosphate/cardiolipin synthase-like enzyme
MASIAGALVYALLLLLNMSAGQVPVEGVEVITDRQYEQVVGDAFARAHSSIRMMMFEARYYESHLNSPTNALIQELIAARKRGVDVKVILERRKENDRVNSSNLKTGALLSRGGVEVMYDPLTTTTHSKLLIIDGETSVVGSTNWTYNALEKNHEVSALIRSPQVARTLQDYFQDVWKSCAPRP